MGRLLRDCMVGLMATFSRKAYATGHTSQVCCSQRQCSCGRPLLTHASAGDTQNVQRQVWLSLCVVSGSWWTQGFVWVSSEPLWQVWSLIMNAISSLLQFYWGFSFTLGYGISFFGGIQHSPADGCSAASYNFGALTGEYEHVLILHHLICGLYNNAYWVVSSITSLSSLSFWTLFNKRGGVVMGRVA